MPQERRILGLISDTHGLLRASALEALRGAELILHAGDVGGAEILEQLSAVAPVVAVRGNVDLDTWGRTLPLTEMVEFGGVAVYMLHILEDLDINPATASAQIVVSGHSHKPASYEKQGVLYINPGSAGPRRFTLPITVARLDLGIRPWKVQFVPLEE
ncbi:MAG TPA: metallophosphoesterase family protein [Candidatus Acidoferrum sp.]|nr:metallophosphoesterase family protein [Candidatus Acidoferrum sp.]